MLDGLIMDNFAGGGGASTGIEMAFGRSPDYAINHDAVALGMHAANHGETVHMVNDVWDVDPWAVAAGRPVGFAWFSPDCRHHSKAKGGAPVTDSVRDLAWVAVKYAKIVKPRVIMLENVEEFQLWGPLDKDNRPDKTRQGETFRQFVAALENEGYVVDWRELRACDYGVPTIRKRLFLVARCDGKPIVWPEATHADPKLNSDLLPWAPAHSIIDWSVPAPSIFDSSETIKEMFGVRANRPLADNTLRRVAHGVKKFILDAQEPFFISYAQHGGHSRSAWDPMHTITASSKDQNQLIAPTLVTTGYGERAGQAPRAPGLDKPLGTITAGGGKHALVSAFMAQHNTGVIGRPLDAPLSTLTGRGTQQNVVSAMMMNMHGTARSARSMDDPVTSICASGNHAALVSAFMVKYYGTAVGQGITEPLHSVTTKGRFGLVTCQLQGQEYAIVDIGMRMLTPREQFRAQGFGDDYKIDQTADGQTIGKTQQTHKCGNSVCPPLVAALIRANFNL
jgi:DNA (cytosine-5)-methyltransferase 1